MRILVFLAPIVVLCSAATAAEIQRPMHEMQGDCANYRWDMARELALWAGPEKPELLAAAPTADAPVIGPGVKYALRLASHPSVTYSAKPEQDRGGPDRFSGIARLTVPADGLYRVSAGSGLWIDVAEGGHLVKSDAFEMQTKCATIFKSVAFRLRGGTSYWLQLNGNRTDAVGLLVTPVGR